MIIFTIMNELNISPIHSFESFINEYPIREMRDQFRILASEFPYHRAVRGDGNCFYRAFAFLHLISTDLSSFQRLFPPVEYICSGCSLSNINTENLSHRLFYYWQNHLKQIGTYLNRELKANKIEKLMNNCNEFDQLLVAYFRSANYWHIEANQDKYALYMDMENTIGRELDRISVFDKQSQGIQIWSLAELKKVVLVIFYVDEHSFHPHCYNEGLGYKDKYYLFYRPGHYDIVFQSANLMPEETPLAPKKPVWHFPNPFKAKTERPQFIQLPQSNYSLRDSAAYPANQPKTAPQKCMSLHNTEPKKLAYKQSPEQKTSLRGSQNSLFSKASVTSINASRIKNRQSKSKVFDGGCQLGYHRLFLEVVSLGLILSLLLFFYSIVMK